MSGCLKAALIGGAVALALGLGSCIVLAVAVDDAAEDIEADLEAEDEREAEDVGDPECRVDDLGFMEAELTVTNNSSERSSYFIDVTFEAPDGSQIETGAMVVNDLEPNQSKTDVAATFTEPGGEFTCRVVDVERISAEN